MKKMKKIKYQTNKFLILYFSMIIFQGFAIGQRGPAFLDLQIITHTDMEAASFFFTSSSAGYLVGSLVAGVVYNKLNKSLLLLLTVLGLAVTTVAVPWCSPYTLMLAIHFVASLFAGGLDTGWWLARSLLSHPVKLCTIRDKHWLSFELNCV